MDWTDVNNLLFEGTEEQIKSVRCPACGGSLQYEYFPTTRNTKIGCTDCGTCCRSHGAHCVPNFALIGKGQFTRKWIRFLWRRAYHKNIRRINKNNKRR